MDMARSLGHVDGGQEEALEALCRAAQAELAGRLRPEVRSEDCEDAFILACAWLALAGLAAGETGGGRFTAGSIHCGVLLLRSRVGLAAFPVCGVPLSRIVSRKRSGGGLLYLIARGGNNTGGGVK